MTAVATTRGTKLVLKVEWVPGSGTYEIACTLNADRGYEQTANLIADVEVDCDDPDAVANETNDKDTIARRFNGTGKLHKQDVKKFDDWLESPDPLNCKVILDDDDAANVITHTGAYHLSTFSWNAGGRGTRVTGTIAAAATGATTRTYGANVD